LDHYDTPAWSEVTEHLEVMLKPGGLDLIRPLRAGWYNDAVAEAYRLPDFGRPETLAVLMANSRALWTPFVAAYRRDPDLQASPDPLDAYVRDAVDTALAIVPYRREVRWAQEPPPRRIAMQRVAEVAGLAHRSRSYLSVHSVYGPWIALRAVIVFDIDGPPERPPRPEPPCQCERHCLPVFRQAMAAADETMTHPLPDGVWQRWLAVRDACPVGRDHRYDEAQIRYHYTHDRRVLSTDSDRRAD
jgi:methylmalonic aciduria homocystinuria type C protein